jgi:hypothetical protein
VDAKELLVARPHRLEDLRRNAGGLDRLAHETELPDRHDVLAEVGEVARRVEQSDHRTAFAAASRMSRHSATCRLEGRARAGSGPTLAGAAALEAGAAGGVDQPVARRVSRTSSAAKVPAALG